MKINESRLRPSPQTGRIVGYTKMFLTTAKGLCNCVTCVTEPRLGWYVEKCIRQSAALISSNVVAQRNIYVLNPRPVGVCRSTRPVGEGPFWPPEISRTTQRSDKRQTALDSPWRGLSKACNFFFENRGHGAGQTEVKSQILLFYNGAYWGQKAL